MAGNATEPVLVRIRFQKMKKIILAGLPLAFLVGCTSSDPHYLPDVTANRSPADAHSGIRHQHPSSVVRGYNPRKVVEPEGWRKRNAEPPNWRDQNAPITPTSEPKS